MKLADQMMSYIAATFTGIWIETREADEAEREIVQHARKNKWKIAVWDVANGLRVPGATTTSTDAGTGDPLAALRALPALADDKGTAILVLHNFHRFLTSVEVVQTVFAQLVAGKQQRTFIVVLAPTSQIPVELEKLFVIIEHALPDREQLERIAHELTSDRPDDISWTGAEIRSCCRLAALLDISLFQATQHVVPVAVTAAEPMEKLRTWASGRCLSASNPGIYSRDGQTLPKPGRRIRRDPSDN